MRWEIETAFDHLKTTLRMDVLRSKTVDGIKKELLAYFIVYNLVRLVMMQAGRRQGLSPKRISFADALRWLACATANTRLTVLLVVPCRPARFEPHTKKRRDKPYASMLLPHPELRKKKLSQCLER